MTIADNGPLCSQKTPDGLERQSGDVSGRVKLETETLIQMGDPDTRNTTQS